MEIDRRLKLDGGESAFFVIRARLDSLMEDDGTGGEEGEEEEQEEATAEGSLQKIPI